MSTADNLLTKLETELLNPYPKQSYPGGCKWNIARDLEFSLNYAWEQHPSLLFLKTGEGVQYVSAVARIQPGGEHQVTLLENSYVIETLSLTSEAHVIDIFRTRIKQHLDKSIKTAE